MMNRKHYEWILIAVIYSALVLATGLWMGHSISREEAEQQTTGEHR